MELPTMNCCDHQKRYAGSAGHSDDCPAVPWHTIKCCAVNWHLWFTNREEGHSQDCPNHVRFAGLLPEQVQEFLEEEEAWMSGELGSPSMANPQPTVWRYKESHDV